MKHASSLDLLLQPGYEDDAYKKYARDSASFMQHGAGKKLTVFETTTDLSGKKPDVTREFSKYLFRSDGQISSSGTWHSDSTLASQEDYVYLRTGQVCRIIKSYGTAGKRDTTQLTYDRAGKLLSYCEKGECILRLYNSKGQLIVKGNALYGYIRGDYTYAYDEAGRLVQRKFLEKQSGVVLCTDTIQYSFLNNEKTLFFESHDIKIAGSGEWIPIDRMLVGNAPGHVFHYTLFHRIMRGGRGIAAPGEIDYTYDKSGKLLSTSQKDKNGMEEKTYSRHPATDTVRTYKVILEKNSPQRILSSQAVIVYDSNGLITSVTSTDYKIIKQRKKWKVSVAETREEKYQWN